VREDPAASFTNAFVFFEAKVLEVRVGGQSVRRDSQPSSQCCCLTSKPFQAIVESDGGGKNLEARLVIDWKRTLEQGGLDGPRYRGNAIASSWEDTKNASREEKATRKVKSSSDR
jgi:hypothetical protein